MEEKNLYTNQEVEEMLIALEQHTNQYNVYLEAMCGNKVNYQIAAINILNKSTERCNQKIPKSLIDKLRIKKIE